MVKTCSAYYDGPLLGVADYKGIPHVYEAEFSVDKDEYTKVLVGRNRPEVTRIGHGGVGNLTAMEDRLYQGATGIDTHPAPPQDRPRHAELKQS